MSKQSTDYQSTSLESLETPMTKVELLSYLSQTGIPRKKVEELLHMLFGEILPAHIKKDLPFSILSYMKCYGVKKQATPEKEGKNPFTGEKMVFPAKPEHLSVRIKALKKLKDSVN